MTISVVFLTARQGRNWQKSGAYIKYVSILRQFLTLHRLKKTPMKFIDYDYFSGVFNG